MTHRGGMWYAVGFDIAAQAPRTFTFTRIRRPVLTLTAFGAAGFLRRGAQGQPRAREAGTAAESSYTAALVKRDNADAAARQLITQVVAGVVADPAEGDNGELYKLMGYVRRTERSSGLIRRAQEKEVSQPLAA